MCVVGLIGAKVKLMGVVGLGTSGRPLFKRVTSGYIEKTREREEKKVGWGIGEALGGSERRGERRPAQCVVVDCYIDHEKKSVSGEMFTKTRACLERGVTTHNKCPWVESPGCT